MQYAKWGSIASVLSIRNLLKFALNKNIVDWVYNIVQQTIKMPMD